MIIESREQKVSDLKAVLGDIFPDKEGLLSEIEVIRSRSIADRVIERMGSSMTPSSTRR